MTRIALLADRNTATYFKIGGLSDIFPIKNEEEAREKLLQLATNKDYSIIAITQRIIEQIKPTVIEVMDKKYPIIISIPDTKGPIVTRTELIGDLIQSKTGIEFNLR
jgi:vacuolar-type H+-ATPase subunit F/Vma7